MTIFTLESYYSTEVASRTYIVLIARNNETKKSEELIIKYHDYCFIEEHEAKRIARKYDLKIIDGYKFYDDEINCCKVYFNSTSLMKTILKEENIQRATLIYLRPERKFLIDLNIKYKFIVNTDERPINPDNIFPIISDKIDKVRTIYCDIEVDSEGDMIFPTGDNAIHPVISIAYICPEWDIIWTVLNKDLKEKQKVYFRKINEIKTFKNLPKIFEVVKKHTDSVKIIEFKNETDLIAYVGEVQREYDNYIITGWNFLRFDTYYLIGRCKVLGIPKECISINNELNHSKSHDQLGRETVKVWTTRSYFIDALEAFIKYYPDHLDHNDLDFVSSVVLGEEFSKLKLKYSIRETFKKDKEMLMTYNIIDCVLVKLIDEKIRLFQFYELRRKEKGLPISSVFSTITPIEAALLYFAEKEKVALPNKERRERSLSLTGANVFTEDPNIFPYGIMVDFRSEYPSICASLNCSRKTLVKDRKLIKTLNFAYEVYKKSNYKNKPKILNNYTTAPGQEERIWFDNSKDCFEKKFLMERFVLREKYFKLANQYDFDSLEYKIYHAYEQDKKLDGNSFYGALANKHFRLAEIKCSQAITSVGRALLDFQREVIFNLGFKIGISDTDSADFVTEDASLTLEEVVKKGYEIQEKLADEIDDFVQKEFLFGSKNGIREGFNPNEDNSNTHWIFAKFEQLFHPLITTGKKKFYAYKLVWKDGKFLKKPKYVAKGLPCIKRDSPKIFRDAQFGLVKHMLDEGYQFKDKVINYLKSFKKKMRNCSLSYLAGSALYKNEINEYKQVQKGYLPPIGAQAMCNSMANFNITFEPLSRFNVLKVKRIKSGKYEKKSIVLNGVKITFKQDVVAFNNENELPDDFLEYFQPDYDHIYNEIIIRKNEIFLKMLGIDPIIFTGQIQLTKWM